MSRTTKASWTKRVIKWRRWAEEMRDLGEFEIREVSDLDVPPPFRHGPTSASIEISRTGADAEQGSAPDRPGE